MLKKILVVVGVLSILSACGGVQQAVDNADMVCKDGVQYFVYEKWSSRGDVTYSVVPHFKPDGKLYTC